MGGAYILEYMQTLQIFPVDKSNLFVSDIMRMTSKKPVI